MTYTILRIFSTQLLSLQLATMTPTTQPKNPSSRNPRTSCLKRVSHKGQEKRAGPKDVLRRKRIPRSAKSKTKISLHDSTFVKTPPAEAADGKPISGRSPEEVEQALRDSSLPEEHILAICTLAEPSPPNQKNNKIISEENSLPKWHTRSSITTPFTKSLLPPLPPPKLTCK